MEKSSEDTEWWWIDYLEDEFDPGVEAELQLLLEHSQEDRNRFENFRILRKWIKDSDPADELCQESRLARLRQNVMAAVAASPAAGEAESAQLSHESL
jgi:hypothetical protein